MTIILAVVLGGCSENDGKISSETYGGGTAATGEGEKKPALVVEGDTYIITEDNYINGVNEIYANPEKYLGKRIEFEGEYMAEMYENEMFYQVYRTLHEHCDEDHDHANDPVKRVGFRISYDGDKPNDESFVRVSGILDTYEDNGTNYLIIKADLLKKCEETGIVELH